MGGTFAVIYAAYHLRKIKNLITLAIPTDYEIYDAVLFSRAKKFDVDKMMDRFVNLPGDRASILPPRNTRCQGGQVRSVFGECGKS